MCLPKQPAMTTDARNILLSWLTLALTSLLVAWLVSCTPKPTGTLTDAEKQSLNGPWKRPPRRIPENAGIHRDGTFRGNKR